MTEFKPGDVVRRVSGDYTGYAGMVDGEPHVVTAVTNGMFKVAGVLGWWRPDHFEICTGTEGESPQKGIAYQCTSMIAAKALARDWHNRGLAWCSGHPMTDESTLRAAVASYRDLCIVCGPKGAIYGSAKYFCSAGYTVRKYTPTVYLVASKGVDDVLSFLASRGYKWWNGKPLTDPAISERCKSRPSICLKLLGGNRLSKGGEAYYERTGHSIQSVTALYALLEAEPPESKDKDKTMENKSKPKTTVYCFDSIEGVKALANAWHDQGRKWCEGGSLLDGSLERHWIKHGRELCVEFDRNLDGVLWGCKSYYDCTDDVEIVTYASDTAKYAVLFQTSEELRNFLPRAAIICSHTALQALRRRWFAMLVSGYRIMVYVSELPGGEILYDGWDIYGSVACVRQSWQLVTWADIKSKIKHYCLTMGYAGAGDITPGKEDRKVIQTIKTNKSGENMNTNAVYDKKVITEQITAAKKKHAAAIAEATKGAKKDLIDIATKFAETGDTQSVCVLTANSATRIGDYTSALLELSLMAGEEVKAGDLSYNPLNLIQDAGKVDSIKKTVTIG